MAKLKSIKLVLCGPGDVAKEMEIAAAAIEGWNRLHGASRGVTIRCQHWSTDTYPDARQTGQGAVNRQIIDEAHFLVAIFWSRLGTPTAAAESGTVEEIRRGIAAGKYVMIYFSDLETMAAVDEGQKERLWQFRRAIRQDTSCATFQSRSQFKEMFTNHLALALDTFVRLTAGKKPKPKGSSSVRQTSRGTGNVQIAGDGNQVNHYQRPPTIKNVIARRPGSVTPEEEHQISEWIKELAEGAVNKERGASHAEWGARFLKHFQVEKRGSLPSSRMLEVEQWFHVQKAIQTAGHKTEAPEQWRAKCIIAIKAAMREMDRSKEEYYPAISARLNMRKAFVSLTKVTKTDLERIYRLVKRDYAAYRS